MLRASADWNRGLRNMRLVNFDARALMLLGLFACGDAGSGDGADDNSSGGNGSQDGGGAGSPNGDDASSGASGGVNGGATGAGAGAGADKVGGMYMAGTADALVPTNGFVFTDPKDQNQNQEAYKIILTAEPAVGCNIKDLDTKLGKLSDSDENVGPNRYLLCRLRATDANNRHPASLLGIGFAGFRAIGPDQLECIPTFKMMGKSAGDRVVGSMKWVDTQRTDAEVGSFEFDLQYCGEVDTLSM